MKLLSILNTTVTSIVGMPTIDNVFDKKKIKKKAKPMRMKKSVYGGVGAPYGFGAGSGGADGGSE